MSTASTWAPSSGPGRYGLSPDGPLTTTPSELHAIPSPSQGAAAAGNPLDPSNPLFWFGAIALVTFGLAAFSTTVRVGKGQLSLAVGKS